MCLCVLQRNSKWLPKVAGKRFLEKVASQLWGYPPRDKKFQRNHSISHHFQDKGVFPFYAEIQDSHQKWWQTDFWEKSPVDSADTLGVKNFKEIAVSHTVSEINVFLHFTQKFKMAAKNGGKTILRKTHQLTLELPWRSKILTKTVRNRAISSKFLSHKLRKLKFFVFNQDNILLPFGSITHLQSYQSQMQYQVSYRHNNLIFPILLKYLESFSLKCKEIN